jgi:hypothetical protein
VSANVAALKATLDAIDRETVAKGKDKVVALWQLEKYGMWRKGRAVLRAYPELEKRIAARGRGDTAISFSEIERCSGRNRETICKWVKLFLAHEDEKEFLAWAKEQAPAVLAKWEAQPNRLVLLTDPGNTSLTTHLSYEEAEDFTRLLGEKIASDCWAVARRFAVDCDIVHASVMAMLSERMRASQA